MVVQCPRCRKKNRLPAVLQDGGEYRCGSCRQTLSPGTGGGGVRTGGSEARTTGREQPATSGRPWLPVAVLAGDAVYLLALLAVSLTDYLGPERWAWSTLTLYLPRWAWAVPGLLLFTLSLWRVRRGAWVPALGLLWALGPLMGFCWRPSSPLPRAVGRLRVMTYNVAQDSTNARVRAEVEAARPDLILFQEANAVPAALLQSRPGWHVFGPAGGCLVLSRYPLVHPQARTLPFAPRWRQYLRVQVRLPGGLLTVYDLHLDTPREGLEDLRVRKAAGLTGFEENTTLRLVRAAGVAADLRRERGPLVVAGDLNAPVQSLVCRALAQDGLSDAFSAVGRGYGYTYGHRLRLHHSYVRIDHVFTSPQVRAARCWAGGAAGSDHRPVIADLLLPSP